MERHQGWGQTHKLGPTDWSVQKRNAYLTGTNQCPNKRTENCIDPTCASIALGHIAPLLLKHSATYLHQLI